MRFIKNLISNPANFRRTVAVALVLNGLLGPAGTLYGQTELGAEDDFTVAGTDGTEPDPDVEIKGFTVFGATQAAYTGVAAGAGNVVVNGALAVSSGAYFVGNSTFIAASRIFINDGSNGQLLSKNSGGYLQWTTAGALADNLGNHIATTTLNMAGFGMVNVASITVTNFIRTSTLTVIAPDTVASSLWVSTSATTPHLYVSTNGNIGIGTTVPAGRLHVDTSGTSFPDGWNDNLKLSGIYPSIWLKDTSSNSGYLIAQNGDTLNFMSETADGKDAYRMVLTNAGNVGIGTTSPVHKLDIKDGNMQIERDGGFIKFKETGYNDVAGIYFMSTGSGNSNQLRFTVSGSNIDPPSQTQAMVINQSGSVGIGTTEPGSNLHIYSASSYPQLRIESNQAGGGDLMLKGSAGHYELYLEGADLRFWDTADRVTFQSGGNVGIGTTGPGANLHISSASASAAQDMLKITTGTANADVFVVKGDGNVGIGTVSPGAKLDIVSTGTLISQYAQIWRASDGTIVSSMTATGVLYPAVSGSDNTKVAKTGDTMTGQLTISGSSLTVGGNIAASTIAATGDITAARYQINGSTVLAVLPGISSFALGTWAGIANNGNYNTFVGPFAGRANTVGTANTFIGTNAGLNNTTGGYSTFVGVQAGEGNTTGTKNTFLGFQAGNANNGGYNTLIGAEAGASNSTGNENIYLGSRAGYLTKAGSQNTIIGNSAGYGLADNSFSSSTLLGYRAGYALRTGNDNIFLGWQAGYNVTSGTGNIVIGYNKDVSAVTANNELNIGGVLYGDLSAKTIGISTRVPQAALDIVSTGTAHTEMAQIWRDSSGIIVASMSATGVMMADRFVGDGSGLSGISGGTSGPSIDVSTINATETTPYGGVNITTNTYVQGRLGINTLNPQYPLEVSSPAGTSGTLLAVSTGTSVMMEVKGTGEVISKKITVNGGPSKISNTVGDISIEPAGSNLNVTKNITVASSNNVGFEGAAGDSYMYYDAFNHWLRVYVDGVEVARFEP